MSKRNTDLLESSMIPHLEFLERHFARALVSNVLFVLVTCLSSLTEIHRLFV